MTSADKDMQQYADKFTSKLKTFSMYLYFFFQQHQYYLTFIQTRCHQEHFRKSSLSFFTKLNMKTSPGTRRNQIN